MCPECGADADTAWSEDSYASGLDLPEESFDYDDFVKREFDSQQEPIPHGIHWFWWMVAIGLAVLLVFGAIRFF